MKLSEETKKLFDAPFAVMGDLEDYTKFNVIIHSRNSPRYCSTIASCIDQKTAIRFARLPELYEALNEAVARACSECDLEMLEPNDECKKCIVDTWVKLLNKIKEGK